MTKFQSATRFFLLFPIFFIGLLLPASGQQAAQLPTGAVDVRIYLISSDISINGTPIPTELSSIIDTVSKTRNGAGKLRIAADFMARAAAGSKVEGRGFIELNETDPVSALDWRIGQLTAEGVGSADFRYILQVSRFSLRVPISLAKKGADEADAPYGYDVASFSSTRSELRPGVPAVLGTLSLAKPRREFQVVAVISPLD